MGKVCRETHPDLVAQFAVAVRPNLGNSCEYDADVLGLP